MYTAKCLVGPSRPVLEYIGILRNTHTHTENHFKCIVLLLLLHVSIKIVDMLSCQYIQGNLLRGLQSIFLYQNSCLILPHHILPFRCLTAHTPSTCLSPPQAIARATSFPLLHLLLQNQQAEGAQNLVCFFLIAV